MFRSQAVVAREVVTSSITPPRRRRIVLVEMYCTLVEAFQALCVRPGRRYSSGSCPERSFVSECNLVDIDLRVNGPHYQGIRWDRDDGERSFELLPLSIAGKTASLELLVLDDISIYVIIVIRTMESLETNMDMGKRYTTVKTDGPEVHLGFEYERPRKNVSISDPTDSEGFSSSGREEV